MPVPTWWRRPVNGGSTPVSWTRDRSISMPSSMPFFSHAALHWVKEPDAVLAGVRRALKPAGRFVGDMGGAGNIAREVAALGAALDRRGYDPEAGNPWYFPTAEA